MIVHGAVMVCLQDDDSDSSATPVMHGVKDLQQEPVAESKNQRKKRLRQEAYLKKKAFRTVLRRQKRKDRRLLVQSKITQKGISESTIMDMPYAEKEKPDDPYLDSEQSAISTAYDVQTASNDLSDAPTSPSDSSLKEEVLMPLIPTSRPSRREQHAAGASLMSSHVYWSTLAPCLSEFAARCQKNPTIIIDCNFQNKQTARVTKNFELAGCMLPHLCQELVSLAQQLMYTYGTNRRLSEPFRLVMCGLFPDLLEVLHRVSGFSSWQCICTSKSVPDYLGWSRETVHSPTDNGGAVTEFLGARTQCVYLTADSESVLREPLTADKIYIIGGLVDRNRYPGITSARAREWNISTASLPIREHCSRLSGSKVLTVNQVFSILGGYADTRDWKMALDVAIPSRKQKVTVLPTANTPRFSETTQ